MHLVEYVCIKIPLDAFFTLRPESFWGLSKMPTWSGGLIGQTRKVQHHSVLVARITV